MLGELKALELIYEKAYFPELSYMFKHALTHDVAYSTLLNERKRTPCTASSAIAVEELYADRLAEQYETLAYHYERGEEWPKALEYLVKAAEKAVSAYANADAITYFGRALDISERPESGISAARFVQIAQSRAETEMIVGDLDGMVADMERAVRLARDASDHQSEVRALSWLGMAHLWLHDFAACETTLAAARELAEQASDLDGWFGSNVFSAELYAVLGGPVEAAPFFEKAASLQELTTDDVALASFLVDSVFIRDHWRGNYDVALQRFTRHGPDVISTDQTQWIIAYEWEHALAVAHAGEYERALSMLHAMIEHSARVGEVMFAPRALNSIAWVYGELEHHEAALDWNQRSFDDGVALGLPDPEIECNALLNIADSLITLERFDEAEEKLAFVGRVVDNPTPPERWMLWRYSQHYYHSLGELRLHQGDAESALMLAERCLRLAEDTQTRKNIVKARRLRGQAHLALGDVASAETEIAAALELATDVANPGQLWKTHEAMGDLRSRQGRTDEARAAFKAALGVMEGMAASLATRTARRRLRHLTRCSGFANERAGAEAAPICGDSPRIQATRRWLIMARVKKEQSRSTTAAPSSRLAVTADRHAERIAFALAQLAARIEASDGSDTAMWRIRQCEAIVQANVRRALAEMMPRDADESSRSCPIAAARARSPPSARSSRRRRRTTRPSRTTHRPTPGRARRLRPPPACPCGRARTPPS